VRAEDYVPPAAAVGAGGEDGVEAEGGQRVLERFGDLADGFGVSVLGRCGMANAEAPE
jgi:hypothetical protein